MSGRSHAPRRRGLPLAATLVAMGLAGSAAVLATTGTASAQAAATVTATFGVTGVSTSNCSVSTGGSDVYVTPGGALDFKTSVAGITLLGIPLDTSGVAGFDGALVIDPGQTFAKAFNLLATKDTNVPGGLSAGNHPFTWSATEVNVLGIAVPLGLDTQYAAAGAKLSYAGTIHVTTAAAQCGVAVQLPGVAASASVTGLPPIKVSLPPIALPTIPVTAPNLGGLLPGGATPTTAGGGSATSGSGLGYNDPGQQVPAAIVPKGGGNGLFGEGSSGSGSGSSGGGGGGNGKNAALTGTGGGASGSPTLTNGKTVDLSAQKTSAAQIPVVLAVLAIVALSLVSAAYARMYLLRRSTV